jgi:4-diphosphocytidyl-2-C-methyl-D-erythritol kinase
MPAAGGVPAEGQNRDHRPMITDATAMEPAPAKVNLALHVTGRRADGFHTLDTLVAFPPITDIVTVSATDKAGTTLIVDGRFAAMVPSGADNLVARAAALLAARRAPLTAGVRIALTKTLPVAAGVGGGSADAAATLRALDRLWDLRLGVEALAALGQPLGADVAMCVHARPLRAGGIGDVIDRFVPLPPAGIVLINPGVAAPTPAVFAALGRRDNPGLPPLPGAFVDAAALARWLRGCRNDLETAARVVAPVIGDVLAMLQADTDVLLARLSGSGATVFALTTDLDAASAVAARIAAQRPLWWVAAAPLDTPT